MILQEMKKFGIILDAVRSTACIREEGHLDGCALGRGRAAFYSGIACLWWPRHWRKARGRTTWERLIGDAARLCRETDYSTGFGNLESNFDLRASFVID